MGKLTIAEETLTTPSSGFGRATFDPNNKQWLQRLSTGVYAGDFAGAITAQIASHSADTYYKGLQLPQFGLQTGQVFFWQFDVSKTGIGTAAPVYTLRVGSNQSTADTSRLAMTGSAQTGVTDTGFVNVMVTVRVAGAACVLRGLVWLQHNLAATGLASTPAGFASVGGTSASFDASAINGQYLGLSVNPGASGSWVIEQCLAWSIF